MKRLPAPPIHTHKKAFYLAITPSNTSGIGHRLINPNQRKPTNQQTVNRKALQTFAAVARHHIPPHPHRIRGGKRSVTTYTSKASTQSEAEKRRHPVLVQPGRCPRGRSGLPRGGRDGTGRMNLQVNWSSRGWISTRSWLIAAASEFAGGNWDGRGERKASVGGRGAERNRGEVSQGWVAF
jgi:hypothetical protein